jgi:CDP-glycerol glycerophosphotransferase
MSKILLFIGRPYTVFSDNLKYAFLSYVEHGTEFEPIYLTPNIEEYDLLQGAGLPVIHFEHEDDVAELSPSLGAVVSDSHDWRGRPKLYESLAGIPFINLWHGLPLKKVGLNMLFDHSKTVDFEVAAKHSLMSAGTASYVSTSAKLTEDIWKRSFHAEDYPVLGYARNDLLFRDVKAYEELNVDPDALLYLTKMKEAGSKIVLCCPTFRESSQYSLDQLGYNLEQMSAFGERHNMAFLLKLHPIFPRADIDLNLSRLKVINHKSDVYPILRQTDALVTDFSSIFFDYLLLNKPILFFTNDLQEYRSADRGLSYRFEDLACGPVCSNLEQLFSCLSDFGSLDSLEYQSIRCDLRDYVHEVQDMDSALRFVRYIDSRYGAESGALSKESREVPMHFRRKIAAA